MTPPLWILALALVVAGVALNIALRIWRGPEATISHRIRQWANTPARRLAVAGLTIGLALWLAYHWTT